MSDRFNPTSTSGIGFHLEHLVQASYVIAFITQIPLPFLDNFVIRSLAFQAKHRAETDDLLITGDSLGVAAKIYLQSKKGFTVGKNETFDKVIEAAYSDYKDAAFAKSIDRFCIVTDRLSTSDNNDTNVMLDWARYSSDEEDFHKKLSGNSTKKARYTYFKNKLEEIDADIDDKTIWEFIKHIHIAEFDYLATNSNDIASLKAYLKPYLKNQGEVISALNSIVSYIVECNKNAAVLTNENISAEIKNLFQLESTPLIQHELRALLAKSKSQLTTTVFNEIDGFHLNRQKFIDDLRNHIGDASFVILSGIGGAGKSAIAKDFINEEFKSGVGYLYFKADIFDKPSLSEALSSIGVHSDIDTIFSQWITFPKLFILIDSFEKLYESNYSDAFLELLAKVKSNPRVIVVASCRTYAFETLRIKFALSRDIIREVPIPILTSEELDQVAKAKPELMPIIQNPKLKNIVSIPFYLNIAAKLITIPGASQFSEVDFKSALWEHIVEKKGFGKAGHSALRGIEFSKVVLKRAIEKSPYTDVSGMNIEIIEELRHDGLLVKHPKLDLFTPTHDIFEDIVVSRHLSHTYEVRRDIHDFIVSINTTPVIRRGLRIWVQDFIVNSPEEGQRLLQETFYAFGRHPIIDEFLLGLLASESCETLLHNNREILLENNGYLFDRLFHLARIAFVEEYSGENPERDIKTIGPCWNAMFQFWLNHQEQHKFLEGNRYPLLYHWSRQFETDDNLPAIAKDAARICFTLLPLEAKTYSFSLNKSILEILYVTISAARDQVEPFLTNMLSIRERMEETDSLYGFSVSFYRNAIEMLLVDTYRCQNVYKYFPHIVISLAKISWFSGKVPTDFSTKYQQASFGLHGHPFDYFSPSALQTPFRYLFRFHFDLAVDFMLEICNRIMPFYTKTSYSEDLVEIELTLNDGGKRRLMGNYALWSTYRGFGNTPYLAQSILMSFEVVLFECIEKGIDVKQVFINIVKKSNTVLPIGVLASAAIKYPFAFGKNVTAILSHRMLFKWDLNRYANEFSSNHTEMGNERYYTSERYHSNRLNHRTQNLESLVSKLQFIDPGLVNPIIDAYLANLEKDDEKWRIALIRMDLRNTVPEVDRDAGTVTFNPKPFPEDLQKSLDLQQAGLQGDTSAMSIYLWASKAFDGNSDVPPTYEQWSEYFANMLMIEYTDSIILDPRLTMSALGVSQYSDLMNGEQCRYCAETLEARFEDIVQRLKNGNSFFDIDEIKGPVFLSYSNLLREQFIGIVSNEKVKSNILDVLLLPSDKQKQALLKGISKVLWEVDPLFAETCLQILLNESTRPSMQREMQRMDWRDQQEALGKVEHLLIERKDIANNPNKSVSLTSANEQGILNAVSLIAPHLLVTTHDSYLIDLINEIGKIKSTEDYEIMHFINDAQEFIAKVLIKSGPGQQGKIMDAVLDLYTVHPKFVHEIFKWFIACAHDYRYPDTVSKVFAFVLHYIETKNPQVAFANFILLVHLRNPIYATKLPNSGDIKYLHKEIITKIGSDPNLSNAIFQLLAGVGSVYQPESLYWLKEAMPEKKQLQNATSEMRSFQYMEEYAKQLFDFHNQIIKRDRELLEYYLLLLDILIDKGSKIAFRLRDIVL